MLDPWRLSIMASIHIRGTVRDHHISKPTPNFSTSCILPSTVLFNENSLRTIPAEISFRLFLISSRDPSSRRLLKQYVGLLCSHQLYAIVHSPIPSSCRHYTCCSVLYNRFPLCYARPGTSPLARRRRSRLAIFDILMYFHQRRNSSYI